MTTPQTTTGAPQTEKPKLREPESKEINISSKKEPKSYKLISKLILRKFGELELRSLGNASESVVQLAESLVRNNFAVYERIESSVAELEDANNETGTRQGIKFTVKLKKSPKFDELTKDLE